jgi:hypothetical protein
METDAIFTTLCSLEYQAMEKSKKSVTPSFLMLFIKFLFTEPSQENVYSSAVQIQNLIWDTLVTVKVKDIPFSA